MFGSGVLRSDKGRKSREGEERLHTHMAHKVEHAVDMETVVGLTVQGVDQQGTVTLVETLVTSVEQIEAMLPTGVEVTDKHPSS